MPAVRVRVRPRIRVGARVRVGVRLRLGLGARLRIGLVARLRRGVSHRLKLRHTATLPSPMPVVVSRSQPHFRGFGNGHIQEAVSQCHRTGGCPDLVLRSRLRLHSRLGDRS